MARLDPVTFDQLDDAQRVLWENLTTGPRANPERPHGGLTGADGALIGPFNALLQSPEIGDVVQRLGAALRYGTTLEADLMETAIVTIGGHWRANFEFWAHARLAVEAGVPQEAVDAIRDGRPATFGDERQGLVYRYVRELIAHQRVSDGIYGELRGVVGERGVFELATLVGYYSLVSIGLNTFEVSLPAGVEAPFPE